MKRFCTSVFRSKIWTNRFAFTAPCLMRRPAVLKQDYAKWMLEDPRVNFVIEARGEAAGFSHAGIQAESEQELQDLYARFRAASDGEVLEQERTTCCYAVSDKNWVVDPQSVPWEAFYTHHPSEDYGMPAASGALETGLRETSSAPRCACNC